MFTIVSTILIPEIFIPKRNQYKRQLPFLSKNLWGQHFDICNKQKTLYELIYKLLK